MEIWNDVYGYEGLYQISDLARVKRLNTEDSRGYLRQGYIIKSFIGHDGYHRVYLYKNGKKKTLMLARLVAIAFIPNPENKPEVNHKFGIKSNNTPSDLEWVTASENMSHSYRILGRKKAMAGLPKEKCPGFGKIGELNILSKKVKCDTLDILFGSAMQAAKILGLNFSLVSAVCRGERRHTNGLTFRYLQ